MRSLKKSPSKKHKTDKKVSSGRLTLGISLILFGCFLFFGRNKSVEILSQSFAAEPIRIEKLDYTSDGGFAPDRIVIPSRQIDLKVEKSKVVGGYWEVFSDSAGWGDGSGYPGKIGNQVIFAHAREGLFLPLRNIEVGEKVYIFSQNNYFDYEVSEIKEVSPGQTEVIGKTNEETLTLYTCSGFADSKRLIVVAKPI